MNIFGHAKNRHLSFYMQDGSFMKNRIFGCTVVFLLLLAGQSFGQQPDCLPNAMLVKWKVGSAVQGAPSLQNVLQSAHPELWVSSVEPLLPPVPAANTNAMPGRALKSEETARLEAELSRVCIVRYAAGIDPLAACGLAASVEGVEYAEPYPVCHPLGTLETPNDSLFAQQAFLKTVQAEQAWDICSGNSQTVIAVTDTDVKWDHPDLIDNIWINPGEDGVDGQGNSKRTNGVDDDANGFIDDWHGWDFAGANNTTADNDTRSTSGGHGTAVAGLAGAVTNNKIGVASISHSCKVLPIKIGADGGGSLSFGLQGINYASLMGAKICNASWGTTAYSKTMEDMVALATSRGTLVVGGAGNNGNMVPFYPASFPAVLDAGVCTASDVINSGSTYGTDVDVFTPGDGALTINISNGYSTFGATSAASPLASSLAALVAIHFPSYTPAQILERIRVTADNIDAKNPSRAFLPGRGRINAYRALSDPASPSVRITSYTLDDPNDDGRLDPGEEIALSLNLKNYLDAAPGEVTINLAAVTNPAAVTITKGTVTLPAMPAGATMGTALRGCF
jgi:subtilisin family serine protease